MDELAIKIEGLKKQYRLGTIGGGTLSADLQSWWARIRGKEDPNTKIGEDTQKRGEYFWALNGINLEIKKGEAVGIIGSNGAGKSTLLKILSRVTAPTEGTVRMKGRVSSMLEVGTGFHPELTGRENIYMNGAILGMSKKEVDEKIEDIIEFSECRQFIDTPVKRYSSGMYVKLAFAVAAYLDAEIMIMDEVLAVGDVKFQKKCLNKMGDAASSEGKTILYVSHNMSTIRRLCTRCIVLDHGTVVFDGDVESAIEIYAHQEESVLAPFYDFTATKRPSSDFGLSLFVNSLTFVNKESPTFEYNEPLQFEVEYTTATEGDTLGVYCTFFNEDSTIVGTTYSVSLGVSQKNEKVKKRFSMDISNLASGIYYFYVDFFHSNEFGLVQSCDRPLQKIYFQIMDDGSRKGIVWSRSYYGSVRLNELEVIEDV